MELDFKTVKALSSATRIHMLRLILEKDCSPTEISNEIEKSKSTVSSHLKHLKNAGLVEKDKVDGRRRVLYSSTKKAEAIVEGKERKVKFSIVSSAITGLSGFGLIVSKRIWPLETASREADSIGTMDAQTATETTSGNPEALLYLGLILIVLSLVFAAYGLAIKELEEK